MQPVPHQRLHPRLIPHRQHPTQHVRVPADVFSSAVHDDVRAVRERVLQRRRAEGGIHAQIRAAGVCELRVVGDIKRESGRVDGGLEVDEVAGAERGGVGVQGEDASAGEAGVQFEDAVAAVVAGADGDGARVEVGEEGVEGGEAAGVNEAGVVQELGEDLLEALGGGGVLARVAVLAGVEEGLGVGGVAEVDGAEEGWVTRVAVGRADVEGWGDVRDQVERVVGVDGDGGGVVGLEIGWVAGVGDVETRGGRG